MVYTRREKLLKIFSFFSLLQIMSELGEALQDTLRVSGLYLPPPPKPKFPSVCERPFPSLKTLTIRVIANHLNLWKSMPNAMPLERA